MRRLIAGLAILSCLVGLGLHLRAMNADVVTDLAIRQQLEAALQSPPIQTTTGRASFPYKNFRLIPRAEYDITARVFSTRNYHWNLADDFFRAAPMDIALGWGPLGNYKYKEILHVRQEDRFFKYSWRGEPPLPPKTIISNMANNHIVPANDDIAARIGHIHDGDIVHLKGALIDISEPGHGNIATSLTRDDTGAGACEILWLEDLQIVR